MCTIGCVESACGLGHLVHADGHEPAFLGCDGAGLLCAYIIYIDDRITWGGVDGEAVVEGTLVGVNFPIHHITVTVEVIDARNDGRGIGLLALNLVPAKEIAGVVGTEGDDEVGCLRAEV